MSDHWVEDFICGAFGGAMGFFNLIGWLLIYFQLLPIPTTLWLSAGAGLLFGAAWVYSDARELKRSAVV